MRILSLLALLAAACGPALATSVINDAEVAVLRAHAADGEKYALYETTLADLYLAKAKEEQGHAHYSDAHELASEALRNAVAATRKAAERRGADAAPAPRATIEHAAEAAPAAPGQKK